MPGLTVGEESSASNPRLLFFCRSAGLLVDPHEATYQIDDIRDPSSGASNLQAETALDLVANKVADGVFAIPTGDTSGWNTGTHRVAIRYRLTNSGRQYTQPLFFEMLSSGDFIDGSSYVGYVSTRRLYQDGIFVLSGKAPESLHLAISQASQQIDNWLGRWFEPRYTSLRLDGKSYPNFQFDTPIIAMQKVELAWREGESFKYDEVEAGSFEVYNRHLDGLLTPDDRDNPRVALLPEYSVLTPSVYVASGQWPPGHQNLVLTGVFGYTDPEPQSDRTLIGQTPLALSRVVIALVSRALEDPTYSSIAAANPGSVKSYRTRDQSISFHGDASSSTSWGGWTGDPLLDQALLRFAPAARLSYADRSDSHENTYFDPTIVW